MAVLTGIAPSALMAEDPHMFEMVAKMAAEMVKARNGG